MAVNMHCPPPAWPQWPAGNPLPPSCIGSLPAIPVPSSAWVTTCEPQLVTYTPITPPLSSPSVSSQPKSTKPTYPDDDAKLLKDLEDLASPSM